MARRRNDSREIQSLTNAFFQLSPRAQIVVAVLLLVGLGLALYFSYHPQGVNPTPAAMDDLLLGNPSDAVADWSHRDNYLMVKPYFALSYNSAKGTPNWVSWQITAADLGDSPRKQVFDTDSTLPMGMSAITTEMYRGSGFDRGHLCPHGDRAANQTMSFSTFVMTNIVPQAPNVNEKAWAQVEDYCRALVRSGNDLYVIAGPLGQGGVGKNGNVATLANGKVVVPAYCWKVVVVVPRDGAGDDLSRISAATRVIAILMPNDQTRVTDRWDLYRTSPGDIEERTGLHFFTKLPPAVAAALRKKTDASPIAEPRPKTYSERFGLPWLYSSPLASLP